jgi:hypothetical protein
MAPAERVAPEGGRPLVMAGRWGLVAVDVQTIEPIRP